MQQKCEMNKIRAIEKKKHSLFNKGFFFEKPTLLRLFSIFNIIFIRFNDLTYFEYANLCKQLYYLLLNVF